MTLDCRRTIFVDTDLELTLASLETVSLYLQGMISKLVVQVSSTSRSIMLSTQLLHTDRQRRKKGEFYEHRPTVTLLCFLSVQWVPWYQTTPQWWVTCTGSPGRIALLEAKLCVGKANPKWMSIQNRTEHCPFNDGSNTTCHSATVGLADRSREWYPIKRT